MALLVPLAGLLVAPFVSVLVYVDAARRGRPRRRRLLAAGSAGVVSFAGFLVPYFFAGFLHRAYLLSLKSAPVVGSPLEILAVDLGFGLLVSVLSVLTSVLGGRYSRPDRA